MAASPLLKLICIALVAALLSGCTTTIPAPDKPTPTSENDRVALSRASVVAVLDVGINPYHEVFRDVMGNADFLVSKLFPNATTVPLSSRADYSEAKAEDGAMWKSLQPGKLYHFAGTRVVAMSMTGATPAILDQNGHGTATAALAAQSDPDGLVLAIQVDPSLCQDNTSCLINPNLAKGIAAAATMPNVDTLSISVHVPGNPPDPSGVHPEVESYLEATRLASANGKLVFVISGNEGGSTLTNYMDGPPWIVCVGGLEAANNGDYAEGGRGVDVVANVSAEAASPKARNGGDWATGTSYAAPLVAGTVARAMGLARSWDSGNGTSNQMTPLMLAQKTRTALNVTARPISLENFSATGSPRNDTLLGHVFSPAVPVLPESNQLGWGYVDASLAVPMALAIRTAASPPDATIAMEQAQWQQTREQYWAAPPT